jgi:glyceraldehyde 3-phosphate dehydrogenase
MTLRIGINGLGRIGRCVVRALAEHPRTDVELVMVNGPATMDTHLHLLKYDSVHGRFRGDVAAEGADLLINGKKIILTGHREPEQIDWSAQGVDVVLECTGKFTSKADAARHIGGSVKKVLVSAPATDADATIVYGVNNAALKASDTVISVGSCTTNCLAPVAKVLDDAFGIETGFMTTIHAYTGDQNLVDGSHKDMRRARAAALSMIPSSTGAAKALGLVLPQLAGKLDGTAVRVPTPNVSMVDLCFTSQKPMTKEAINAAMQAAANGAMRGVLAYEAAELVSIDFTHHPASSIFDATGTKVMGGGHFGRVASWYDNEWGFSLRMLDVAGLLG